MKDRIIRAAVIGLCSVNASVAFAGPTQTLSDGSVKIAEGVYQRTEPDGTIIRMAYGDAGARYERELLQRSATQPTDEEMFKKSVLAELREDYGTWDQEELPTNERAFFQLVKDIVISHLASEAEAGDDIIQIAREVLKADLAFPYLLAISGSVREAARRTRAPRNTLGRKIERTLTLVLEELKHACRHEGGSKGSGGLAAVREYFSKLYSSTNEEGERDEY